MKYSTLFVQCCDKVVSEHFTCRAGLVYALMKPIIPTKSKHQGNSDKEKLLFRR